MNWEDAAKITSDIVSNVAKVIYGKDEKIKLLVCAMICGGHALLDDIPGTGKTSLAKAIARSVSAECRRIQFTPDLLPSDVTGINYYSQKLSDFVFRPGPIFTNILIADEINRTTPRTQSALLECMGENQATIDGVTYPLEDLFFVIATQNPIESQGTFPLPEAQTDRFLMKLSLGYPDKKYEMNMLGEYIKVSPLDTLAPVCPKETVCAIRSMVRDVTVSDKIREYIVNISNETRRSDKIRLGVSPRGTLALMRAAQAYAVTEGRDFTLPDDVKAVAVPVLSHRIIPRSQNTIRITETNENIISYILENVSAPIEA